jgi:hypothetical protein
MPKSFQISAKYNLFEKPCLDIATYYQTTMSNMILKQKYEAFLKGTYKVEEL